MFSFRQTTAERKEKNTVYDKLTCILFDQFKKKMKTAFTLHLTFTTYPYRPQTIRMCPIERNPLRFWLILNEFNLLSAPEINHFLVK